MQLIHTIKKFKQEFPFLTNLKGVALDRVAFFCS